MRDAHTHTHTGSCDLVAVEQQNLHVVARKQPRFAVVEGVEDRQRVDMATVVKAARLRKEQLTVRSCGFCVAMMRSSCVRLHATLRPVICVPDTYNSCSGVAARDGGSATSGLPDTSRRSSMAKAKKSGRDCSTPSVMYRICSCRAKAGTVVGSAATLVAVSVRMESDGFAHSDGGRAVRAHQRVEVAERGEHVGQRGDVGVAELQVAEAR